MGLIFLLLAGAALSLPGCSKQGEGERCSPAANGNEDCEEGLVCTAKGPSDFGRCCPPEGAEVSDSRCNEAPTTGTTGGTTSGGGMSGGGGTSNGGTSNGGTSNGGTSNGGTSGGAGTPDPGEGGSGAAPSAGAGGNEDPVATGGSSGAGGA